MSKIDTLIDNMKQLYEELNLKKVKDVNIIELQKLRDFSKNYALDIQELIYGFKEMKYDVHRCKNNNDCDNDSLCCVSCELLKECRREGIECDQLKECSNVKECPYLKIE